MPRLARLVVPNVALHVVQRGHDGRDCFRHDTDYLVYLTNLRDLSVSTGCALHAYCLMTNHVHLLLTPESPQACALLMRNLGQRYVQYFDRRYQRRGTLWEGRFRSCLVDSAQYVIACHRYIELNPVRAGMVASPSAYEWSSYAGNAGHLSNLLLTPHPEYLGMAADSTTRHATYRGLFTVAEEPSFLAAVRNATNGGFALVGEKPRVQLPREARGRLERKPPGPRPRPTSTETREDISAELGLRPRTN